MRYLNKNNNPIKVLLVEDNPGDVILMKKAFLKSKFNIDIIEARDGEIALTTLNNYQDIFDIILLDLNLPKKNGIEVLQAIKNTEILKRIPVIILTSSHAENDIANSYDHKANCYIIKPHSISNFTKIVQSIENFWLSVVAYPNKPIEE